MLNKVMGFINDFDNGVDPFPFTLEVVEWKLE
jgi:hypothetical protein